MCGAPLSREFSVVLGRILCLFLTRKKGLNYYYYVQIAYSLIQEQEQEGKKKTPDDYNYISFVGLLADKRYCGMYYTPIRAVCVFMNASRLFCIFPIVDLLIAIFPLYSETWS